MEREDDTANLEHALSQVPALMQVSQRKAELDALRPLTREQEARIWQKFRLDWNYHSNAIEGNSLDLGETRAFLLHGLTAKGKPFKDYLDLRGHNEAIDYLMGLVAFVRGGGELTESHIRELHQMVLVEPYEMDSMTPDGQRVKRKVELGKYKRMPNHVRTATGETHFYASPEETPIKMGELMAWYRRLRDQQAVHPVVLAALFHHRFSEIHPFDDGNGRLARLLMNLILMRGTYPPAIIPIEERNTYYLTLSQADSGDPVPFVEYLCERVLHSLDISLKGARGERIDEPDDLDKRLAVFKAGLKGAPDTLELRRNADTLQRVYHSTLVPLLGEIEIVLGKFRDLFFDYEVCYVTQSTRKRWRYNRPKGPAGNPRKILRSALRTKTEAPFACILAFRFDKLKTAKSLLGVEVKLLLQFEELHYSVKYSVSERDELDGLDSQEYRLYMPHELLPGEQRYHQELTQEQLAEAARQAGEKLLDYLTKKSENPGFQDLSVEQIRALWEKYKAGVRAPKNAADFLRSIEIEGFDGAVIQLAIKESAFQKHWQLVEKVSVELPEFVRKKRKIERGLGVGWRQIPLLETLGKAFSGGGANKKES